MLPSQFLSLKREVLNSSLGQVKSKPSAKNGIAVTFLVKGYVSYAGAMT